LRWALTRRLSRALCALRRCASRARSFQTIFTVRCCFSAHAHAARNNEAVLRCARACAHVASSCLPQLTRPAPPSLSTQPDAPRTGAVQRGRAAPPRPPQRAAPRSGANIRGVDHSASAMNCGPGGGGG
jgi:hypothetical protein